MFITIAIAVVILIAGLLAFSATKPNTFRVQRVASIKAPPEKIFAFISDFRGWSSWSPYEKLDPAMKKTYSGAEGGRGSVYEWDGNAKVGKGRMEIMEIVPPSRVSIKLDFIKPFEGHNVAEFRLEPKGDTTNVTWSTEGPNAFMTKLMGTFVNMDKMIGKEFENGLANLKALAEK